MGPKATSVNKLVGWINGVSFLRVTVLEPTTIGVTLIVAK